MIVRAIELLSQISHNLLAIDYEAEVLLLTVQYANKQSILSFADESGPLQSGSQLWKIVYSRSQSSCLCNDYF